MLTPALGRKKEKKMKKKVIIFALNFIFSIFISYAKESRNINNKIDFLLKNNVIEIDSEKVNYHRQSRWL